MPALAYRIYQADSFPLLDPKASCAYANVYQGEIRVDPYPGDDFHLRVLNELFRLHNQDGRPAADRIRSLSVGDVVALLNEGRRPAYYMVLATGFERIQAERFVIDPDVPGGVVLLPDEKDGVYLSIVPQNKDAASMNKVFNIPVATVVEALVRTGQIPGPAADGAEVELTVRHRKNVLRVTTSSPAEQDYPGLYVDARDAYGQDIYLANVELPNENYPGCIGARLYNGYGAFESDSPSVLMLTRLREPAEADMLGRYADGVRMLRKIAYVERDQCETRTWDNPVSEEHEYEPKPEDLPETKKEA